MEKESKLKKIALNTLGAAGLVGAGFLTYYGFDNLNAENMKESTDFYRSMFLVGPAIFASTVCFENARTELYSTSEETEY